jgi:hypothetical protein
VKADVLTAVASVRFDIAGDHASPRSQLGEDLVHSDIADIPSVSMGAHHLNPGIWPTRHGRRRAEHPAFVDESVAEIPEQHFDGHVENDASNRPNLVIPTGGALARRVHDEASKAD